MKPLLCQFETFREKKPLQLPRRICWNQGEITSWVNVWVQNHIFIAGAALLRCCPNPKNYEVCTVFLQCKMFPPPQKKYSLLDWCDLKPEWYRFFIWEDPLHDTLHGSPALSLLCHFLGFSRGALLLEAASSWVLKRWRHRVVHSRASGQK